MEDYLYLSHKNYDKLVIVFSSKDPDRKINQKYDLFSLIKNEDYSVLLVRDLNNTWYQGKFSPSCFGPQQLADELRNISKNYRKVLSFGFSMGGYAAILLGRKIAADNIIAISPQVLIGEKENIQLGDYRFLNDFRKIEKDFNNQIIRDLTKVDRESNSEIDIIYSELEKTDILHAKFFAQHLFCKLFPLEKVSHSALSVLNYFGITKAIISSKFEKNEFNLSKNLEKILFFRHHKIIIRKIRYNKIKSNIKIWFLIKNNSNFFWNKTYTKSLYLSFLLKQKKNESILKDYLEPIPEFELHPNNKFKFVATFSYRDLPPDVYELYFNIREGKKVSYEDIGYQPIRINLEVFQKILIGDLFYNNKFYRIKNKNNYIIYKNNRNFRKIYQVSSGRLNTDIGKINNGLIFFKVKKIKGLVLFGPYIELNRGYYKASVHLKKIPKAGLAKIDVISDGNIVHAKKIINFKEVKEKVDITWTLPQKTKKIEVRLYVYNCKKGSIHSLEILKI